MGTMNDEMHQQTQLNSIVMKRISKIFTLLAFAMVFAGFCRIETGVLDDQEFVRTAADGGLLEVKAAESAIKTTSNADIKIFAEMMLKDHSTANTELQSIAKKKGIETPTKLSEKSERKLKDLQAKQSAEFDAAYAAAMVNDHKETVALFERANAETKDTELKNWVESKLPVLRHHLKMAQDLEVEVKK
jgi:putative membrane protein